jgi:hypothetical protein
VHVFKRLAVEAGVDLSRATPVQAWDVFSRFSREGFRVPREPNADGLLYQYGTYDFGDGLWFRLDLTRQFAVRDEDEYLQFRCELRYEPLDVHVRLDRFDEWWWYDDPAPLVVGLAGRDACPA